MTRSHSFTWALIGALLTSIGLNVRLATSESPAASVDAAGAPTCVVDCLPELELTDEQRAAIEACCTDCCSDRDRLGAELRSLCGELARLFAPDASPDADTADLLVTRITSKLGDVLKRRVAAMIRVRETLTKDQITRLERAR